MNVLLSIKPKYVKEIFEGNKKYEFRKSIFKNRKIKKLYIYCSSPVKKVVGTFVIGDIIEGHPKNLWEQFKDFSGINKMEFFNYFNDNKKGYAIQIEKIKKFEYPKSLDKIFPNKSPPQSFCYIKTKTIQKELEIEY